MSCNNQSLFDDAIHSIIHWFKNDYTDASGAPVYDIHATTGRPLSKRNLLCEFDDYAPFFWMAGEKNYVNRQYELLSGMIDKKGLLFSRPQIRAKKGLGLPGIFRKLPYADSQDYVEILYGLLELYSLSQDRKFLQTARTLFDSVVNHFERNAMIRSFRMMPFGPTLSIADAMSGMFIELACDMADQMPLAKDKRIYLDKAETWLTRWLNTNMFSRYGVFQSVHLEWPWAIIPGIRDKMAVAELAKPNASMAYGLLALAAPPNNNTKARNAFDRWIDGLYKHFSTSACVLTHVPNFDTTQNNGPVLSTNFAVLDILCDAVFFFKCDACRDLALSIADYFLRYRSQETGLVPDEPGDDRSYLDANTDFAVSLAKLSEITGDSSYLDSGREILTSIIHHHRAPYGFYRDVDLTTGQPINSIVETRFCSLLLKPLLLYRDNYRIYDQSGNWSVFRDR
jgi:hypothetical protein